MSVFLEPALAKRAYRRAGAERWGLSLEDFSATLARSVAHRFRECEPSARDIEQYVEGLHLCDVALASACARGLQAAWEHFVREFRPAVLAAARSIASPDAANEIAESIYADLFGLEVREGARRSLFDYFHGRSTLAGWLRAVLAQRAVDRARAARRFEPLPDEQSQPGLAAPAASPYLDRPRHLALVRAALESALAALAPRDRLRLALYYTRQLKLAAVGRALDESEATVSRKLERTREELRRSIERQLADDHKLGRDEIAECFACARDDSAFDLGVALPVDDS